MDKKGFGSHAFNVYQDVSFQSKLTVIEGGSVFLQLMPEAQIHVLFTLRDWLSAPEDTLKFECHRAFHFC